MYCTLYSILHIHPYKIDSTVTLPGTIYVSEVNIFEVSPPNDMQVKGLQKKSEVLAWRSWRFVI
jgi:hypothetical protein